MCVSCTPAYKEIFQHICELLVKHQHIVFVYTDNLSVDYPFIAEDVDKVWEYIKDFPRYRGYTGTVEEFRQDLKQRIEYLHLSGLRLAPYRTRVDLNISAQEFLTETFRGLLMRIYIPNDRIWAGEIDKLLTLFADYLQKVGRHAVTLDHNRTENGLVYGFYSADSSITKEQISGLLEEFSIFLKVCADDPAKASTLLKDSNIPDSQLHSILTRYAKEARRLLLDIQYEKDSKLLAIRHRLQSELLDTLTFNEVNQALMQIDKSREIDVQNPLDIMDSTGVEGRSGTFIQAQTINISNPQFISQVKGIVAQEINGTIQYTEEDERIIELFEHHSSDEIEYIELKSSLDELKDSSVPQNKRTTAWQKVQGFLSRNSDTITKGTIDILAKYLENVLTGK